MHVYRLDRASHVRKSLGRSWVVGEQDSVNGLVKKKGIINAVELDAKDAGLVSLVKGRVGEREREPEVTLF